MVFIDFQHVQNIQRKSCDRDKYWRNELQQGKNNLHIRLDKIHIIQHRSWH